jgi:hypothetical protein
MIQQPTSYDSQMALEQAVTVRDLLASAADLGRYGSSRMLTPQQMRERYQSIFKQHGIKVEDLTPEFWVELRRTRFPQSELEGELNTTIADIFRRALANDWPQCLVLLAWVFRKKPGTRRNRPSKDALDDEDDEDDQDAPMGAQVTASDMPRFAAIEPHEVEAAIAQFQAKRADQLCDNINKDYDLLKGYEDARRNEADPKALSRYEDEIAKIKRRLSEYQDELSKLQVDQLDSDTRRKLKLEDAATTHNATDENRQVTFFEPHPSPAICLTISTLPNGGILITPHIEKPVDITQPPDREVVLLNTGTTEQQANAAHVLAEYPFCPSIETALLKAFASSPSPILRAVIADVLGQKKSQAAVSVLIQALCDGAETVRNIAAFSLASIGSPESFKQLALELLTQKFEDLTIELVAPAIAEELVTTATQIWHTLNKQQATCAIHTLCSSLRYIFPALFNTLSNQQDQIRCNAWQLFEEVFDEAEFLGLVDLENLPSFLERKLHDLLWEVRYRTIHILAAMRSESALPILFEALKHPDVNTRPFAAFWLEKTYLRRPRVLGRLSRSSEVLSTFGEPILSKNIGKSAL